MPTYWDLMTELVFRPKGEAASLEEAKANPGTICDVDVGVYFDLREEKPHARPLPICPALMDGNGFLYAKGEEPFLLFFRAGFFGGGRTCARQLTQEESQRIAIHLGSATAQGE